METLNNNKDLMDALIVKLLTGEANKDEKRRLKEWMTKSSENVTYYENLKTIWNNTGIEIVESPSEELAWSKFQDKIQNHKKSGFSRKLWKYAAAAVVLLAIAVYATWETLTFSPMQEIYASHSAFTDTLADKSVITLNKGAKISYIRGFNDKQRKIWLQGEAFFDVAADSNRPFIVHIDNTTVEVLGTTFNIEESQESTTVIVKAGEVKVTVDEKYVLLSLGEKAVVDKKSNKIKVEKVNNQLYNYYVTNSFICDNTPLSKLVKTLGKAYNTDILITNPNLEELPITTTFHRSQSLDNILNIISETFNDLSVMKKEDKIIIE